MTVSFHEDASVLFGRGVLAPHFLGLDTVKHPFGAGALRDVTGQRRRENLLASGCHCIRVIRLVGDV